MARAFLKVYFDFDEKTDLLSDAERARLLLAMYYYAKTGETKPLSGNERYLFSTFKDTIDKDIAAYNSKVENGNKGGRPKTESKPNETEPKPNETETNLNLKNKNKNKNILKESTLKSTKEKSALSTGRNFDKLWSVYPRHEGKQAALKAFEKINPDDELLERMINAITAQKKSAQWADPQFIPHPATWLNGHRWEDEPTKAAPQGKRVLAQQYEQRDYNEKEMQDKLGVYDVYLTDEEYKAKYGRNRQMGGAL